MGKLIDLMTEAEATVSIRRGHNGGAWQVVSDRRAIWTCDACGMEVHVNTRPMPNEIDIGGEAVALNCYKR